MAMIKNDLNYLIATNYISVIIINFIALIVAIFAFIII